MLQEMSASLFLRIFNLPHHMLTILDSGEIEFDDEKLLAYQEAHDLNSNRLESFLTLPELNSSQVVLPRIDPKRGFHDER